MEIEKIKILYLEEGKTLQEIAGIIGCSLTTVYNRLSKSGVSFRNRVEMLEKWHNDHRGYITTYKEKKCGMCRIKYQPKSGHSRYCHSCLKKYKSIKDEEYRNRHYYSGIRNEVLSRDGYKCISCKSINNLIIHHKDGTGMKSKYGSPTPNNKLNNLITLCRTCHNRVHIHILKTGKINDYFKSLKVFTLA